MPIRLFIGRQHAIIPSRWVSWRKNIRILYQTWHGLGNIETGICAKINLRLRSILLW